MMIRTREDSSDEDPNEASDQDSDDFIKQRSLPSVEDNSDDGDFTYREVKITETSYTSYREPSFCTFTRG